MKPLAIDLFCGLGGWTEGLLAEGYEVYGFDIKHHRYPARAIVDSEIKASGIDFKWGDSFNGTTEKRLRAAPLTGGWHEYPAQLILQDVMTIHGSQFRNASLIVGSPPCQRYSYMAMPFSRGRKLAQEYRDNPETQCELNALFNACFRIQREACEAAGHHIPMVVENVKGAQPWVGRAKWHYGSFYLWGDVPMLMPIASALKIPGFNFHQHENGGKGGSFQTAAVVASGTKHGCDWFSGYGGGFGWDHSQMRQHSSKSPARKAASAQIAKIPLDLARHIARVYHPR